MSLPRKTRVVLWQGSLWQKGTIYISVPDQGVDTITLNNDAGDIKMKDVSALNIAFTNHSGSETIEGLSADTGVFTSKDGELKLKTAR